METSAGSELMGRMCRFRSAASHLVLITFGLSLSFLLFEGILRLYMAFAAPQVEPITAVPLVETTIADERLGYRPNPAYPGHDARGWRNAAAFAKADVVILGDSQTYGVNAAPSRAWPQRLRVHLRRGVYQMAYGGYGPAHYVPLLNEALALDPRVILATYYFGNDIYDAYWLVYGIGKVGKYKRSSSDPIVGTLATSDPRMRAAIAEAEIRDPKYLRADYLDCTRSAPQGADPGQLLRGPISRPREEIEKRETAKSAPASPAGPRHIVSQWLSHRSLLFRTVWPRLRPHLVSVLDQPAASVAAPNLGPPLCVSYDDGAMSTVFQVGYRFIVLDDSDPREVEGERISLLALKHLAERCRRAGIHFYVVLIPTKETAFRVRAEPVLRDERLLIDLWFAESRARRRAMAFFTRENISTVDALPALEALIASRVNPYPERADGHPLARGYDAIARAVSARLAKDRVWRE